MKMLKKDEGFDEEKIEAALLFDLEAWIEAGKEVYEKELKKEEQK